MAGSMIPQAAAAGASSGAAAQCAHHRGGTAASCGARDFWLAGRGMYMQGFSLSRPAQGWAAGVICVCRQHLLARAQWNHHGAFPRHSTPAAGVGRGACACVHMLAAALRRVGVRVGPFFGCRKRRATHTRADGHRDFHSSHRRATIFSLRGGVGARLPGRGRLAADWAPAAQACKVCTVAWPVAREPSCPVWWAARGRARRAGSAVGASALAT